MVKTMLDGKLRSAQCVCTARGSAYMPIGLLTDVFAGRERGSAEDGKIIVMRLECDRHDF